MILNAHGGYLKVWVWAFICAALGYFVYVEGQISTGTTSVSPSAQVKVGTASPEAPPAGFAPLPDLKDLAEVVERPLFTQNRLPAPPEAQADTPAQKPGQQFAYDLSGIVITASQQMALLRNTRTREIRQVRLGETIDGWEVTAISADQVILSRGQDTQALKLIDRPQPARRKPPRTRTRARTRTPNLPGREIAPVKLPQTPLPKPK